MAIRLEPRTNSVSIHPTGVNTPMNDGLAALEGQYVEYVERLILETMIFQAGLAFFRNSR